MAQNTIKTKNIEEFTEEKSKDKEFINKYKDKIILVDCMHPLTNKVEECIFYVKTKVTYKGTTNNLLNRQKFKKLTFD